MAPAQISTRRGNWGPILLGAGVVAIYFLATRSPGLPLGWEVNYATAQKQAQTDQKKMLVAFSMDGCPPCRMMERSVLPTEPVKQALAGFVPVYVDAVKNSELAEKMGIVGTPTFVVAASDGTPLLSVSGYVPVDSFVEFLQKGAKAERPVVNLEIPPLTPPAEPPTKEVARRKSPPAP